MIASISGKIRRKTDDGLIVEVAGVGIYVRLSPFELADCAEGAEVFLHTYLVVKEDALDLASYSEFTF